MTEFESGAGVGDELDLITPQEAARILRVTIGTLAGWRHRYDPKWLPWVRVGNRVRYRRRDVKAFLGRNDAALYPKSGKRR